MSILKKVMLGFLLTVAHESLHRMICPVEKGHARLLIDSPEAASLFDKVGDAAQATQKSLLRLAPCARRKNQVDP